MKSVYLRLGALILILSISLSVACGGRKVVTNPATGQTTTTQISGEQILSHVKDITAGLAQAVDEGTTLEASLASQGVIDAAVEPKIRQWLKDGKVSIDAFNARLQTYTKFDVTSKADIAKFAEDALALISKLNDEGVLRIKNPRSQLIATGIISGARVAVRILKSYADKEVAVTPPQD